MPWLILLFTSACAGPLPKNPGADTVTVATAPSKEPLGAGQAASRTNRQSAPSQARGVRTPADELWQRTRNGFALAGEEQRPAVRRWVQFYASRQPHLLGAAGRAKPFLWHIVESLEARSMPLEIALLPIVESGFDPFAYSVAHASGLWQFVPATGRRFGLNRDWWHDGRRNVFASTEAALEYLSWLHGRFDDWLLALAAYNAGEGRVARAIARAERQGKPTDFWHLRLPTQTENYVPKLLALRRIVLAPDDYALTWPTLPNQPQLTEITLPGQIALARAAKMAGVATQNLRNINPQFRRWATHPDGPHRLLVPIDRAKTLQTALASASPDSLVGYRHHRVQRGEVLGRIARRYGTSISLLRQVNEIRGNLIRVGEKLVIPVPGGPETSVAADSEAAAETQKSHQVERGESLWAIGQRYDQKVTNLRRWNNLRADAVLQPGQTLEIRATGAPEIVYYRVRRGDSLWSIAERFSIAVSDLRDWNELAGDRPIRPGQQLRIRADATS